MAGVYGNSILNIAATTAPDGSYGCFQSRRLDRIYPQWLEINLESDRRVFIEESVADFPLEIDSDVGSRIEPSFLYRRAWVVQEVVLAPRTLHFLGNELAWQCSRKTACESHIESKQELPWDDNDSTSSLSSSLINYGKIMFPQPVREPSSENHLQQYQKQVIVCWNRIVSLYSGAELTFEQRDKLVAISGLARAIYDDFGQYVYGLWKFYLPDQLLWAVHHTRNTKNRDRLKFPTWSWASLAGKVSNGFLSFQKYDGSFRILHIAEGKVEANGAVLGAFLQVEAELFFGRLQKEAMLFHSSNCNMSSPSNREETGPVQCSCSPVKLSGAFLNWDSYRSKDDDPVYGAIVKDHEVLTDREVIRGLLLSPSRANNGFTRVGTFDFFEGRSLRSRNQSSLTTQLCKDSEAYIASQPDLYERYIPTTQEQERPRFVFRIY